MHPVLTTVVQTGPGQEGRCSPRAQAHGSTGSCGSVHVHACDTVTLQQNHVVQTWKALATGFPENS